MSSGKPFWLYIEQALQHGVISGYNAGPSGFTGIPCFLLGNSVTRSQTSKFIYAVP